MRVLAVGANPNNLCAKILEQFVRVSESASLSGTALSEVFRIEVNDYVLLSKEIRQGNVTAIACRQSEIRCCSPNVEQLRHFRRSSCCLGEKRLSFVHGLGKRYAQFEA